MLAGFCANLVPERVASWNLHLGASTPLTRNSWKVFRPQISTFGVFAPSRPRACNVRAIEVKPSMRQERKPVGEKNGDVETSMDALLGRVLGPSARDSGWWDSKCLSGPVVIKSDEGWRMYYYGRDSDTWGQGVTPFATELPTGRIGMAVSQDGLRWDKFQGPLPGGAVMDPSEVATAFDSVHVAVSDVLRIPGSSRWAMYYLGGGLQEGELPGMSGRLFAGATIRSGVAFSDDGIHFDRQQEPVLALGSKGDWDELGTSWPRVILPEEGGDGSPGAGDGPGEWLMTYHTRERGGPGGFGFYSAGVATSRDGVNWDKRGKVLTTGAPGSWDDGGVSVRSVLRVGGQYIMFYEGSSNKFNFGIGLATSNDGLTWQKDTEAGPEPGGPILSARHNENAWDNILVGTPYAVKMPDGSFRLYYLGIGRLLGQERSFQGIGLATSEGTNFRRWRRVSVGN